MHKPSTKFYSSLGFFTEQLNQKARNKDASLGLMKKNLEKYLELYIDHMAEFRRDFYSEIEFNVDRTDKVSGEVHISDKVYIQLILEHLNVSPKKRARFTETMHHTMYGFLEELERAVTLDNNKDAIEAIQSFKTAIENRKAISTKKYLKGGAIALVHAITACAVVYKIPGEFTFLEQLLAVTAFTACISMMYTLAVALYTAYTTEVSDIKWYAKVREHAFLVMTAALDISAYMVMAFGAVVLAPLASSLFVAASMVRVVKELAILRHIGMEAKELEIEKFTDHQRVRHHAALELHWNKVHREIVAAIVMTVIIAAWCFLPGGIVLSIAAIVAMGLVYYARNQETKRLEAAMKVKLDKDFEDVENVHKDDSKFELEPEPEPDETTPLLVDSTEAVEMTILPKKQSFRIV